MGTHDPLLVPLDGSSCAEAALPYAEAIAEALGAPLALLSVVEDQPMRFSITGATPETRSEIEQRLRGPMERYLEDTAAGLRTRGLTVTTAVVVGEPAEQILAAAAQSGAAMVIMATHGRGGVERWLVGSVADAVMRLAACPVLLVHQAETGEEQREVWLRCLLVPLDGSPLAEAALPLAGSLARGLGAEVVLARVEPWLAEMAPSYGYLPNITQMDEKAAVAAERYLEEAGRRLPAYLRTRAVVLRGEPAEKLVRYAREGGVDLIVMSTHGRGGLGRLMLGSTADCMVRSGTATLLVRPSQGER